MKSPNNWEIRDCIALCSSVLLTALAIMGLSALGFDIPVLRQVAGFFFLTFIPGILILRILRIHNIHIIESLLYSVGLSLAFVIIMGVVANFALPPLGISKPISLLPLLLVITPAFLLLCLFAYIRDKGFRPSSQSDKQASESTWQNFRAANPAPYLLAALLPLLAILGAILINAYYNNAPIFALIFVIAIVIGLAAFNKFIHPRVYPIMIFMMALALLYQTTFISDYLVGSDIHIEHYVSNLVVEDGHWHVDIPGTGAVNSCLSIVILAPIYSLMLNVDIVWLFKIIYPLFFSLVPLALFRTFSLQMKSQHAFLAVAFFITMPMFFMDMPQLVRQQISELFFVLVILLMIDRKLTLIQRTTLVLIFGCGIVVSYYGLGTAYPIGYLAFGSLVLIVIKSRPGRALWQWLIGKHNSLPTDLTSAGAFNKKALVITVVVSLIFMFAYFRVTSAGLMGPRIFGEIMHSAAEQTIQGITTPATTTPATTTPATTTPATTTPATTTPATTTPATTTPATTTPATTTPTPQIPAFVQKITAMFPFLNPLSKEPLSQTALGIDFSIASPGGKAWRVFQYLVELCLIIGFFRLVFRPGTLGEFKAEYLSLTIVSTLILLGIYILPTTGWGLGSVRIWQITLLLMSPLFIFGGETIALGIAKLTSISRKSLASSKMRFDTRSLTWCPIVFILIPYFIFNSGAIFELSRNQTTRFIDMPYSIALSSYRLDLNTVFTRQDTTAADWLSTVGSRPLRTDIHGCQLFYNYRAAQNAGELASSSYIYLRTWNARTKTWTVGTAYAARQSVSFDDLDNPWLTQALERGDKIYNNDGAQILLQE